MKISGIYLIINVINGKIYVGCAADISSRWIWHRRSLNNKTHHNRHLTNAWHSYGADAFHFCIVEECLVEDLYLIEQIWMTNTDCCNSEIGYNIYPVAGSPRGTKLTEEHKAKISAGGKGRVVSDETKVMMSNYHLNRTSEHRANHSAAMKKRVFTDTHKQKLKEANKRRGNDYYTEEMKLKRRNTFKEKYKKNI